MWLWAIIYSQDRYTYFPQQKRHMNVEIGTETPIFFFWEYLFQISAFCLCSVFQFGMRGRIGSSHWLCAIYMHTESSRNEAKENNPWIPNFSIIRSANSVTLPKDAGYLFGQYMYITGAAVILEVPTFWVVLTINKAFRSSRLSGRLGIPIVPAFRPFRFSSPSNFSASLTILRSFESLQKN